MPDAPTKELVVFRSSRAPAAVGGAREFYALITEKVLAETSPDR